MRHLGALAAALAIALLAAGCSAVPLGTPSPQELWLKTLTEQRALWESKQISDYELSVTWTCFCPELPTYRITVQSGVVTKVTRDRQPVKPKEVATLPKTVPDLFAFLAGLKPEAHVDVAWDPVWGFPNRIDVDPIPNAVDDEYTIAAVGFEAIEVLTGSSPAS